MMDKPNIEPHKVQNPIQLLAVWFAALVLVEGIFLSTATLIGGPDWIRQALVISAIVFVPLFLYVAFLMQTKYRTHLLADPHYAKWLEAKEKNFKKFSPENIVGSAQINLPSLSLGNSMQDSEQHRIGMYSKQEGLFVVHDWAPSRARDQVADIRIWLHQHGQGPLSRNEIEKVVYFLGPKFFNGSPVIKSNTEEKFLLEISAYGPVLCLAQVYIKNRQQPIEITRYVDFEPYPNC